MYANIKIPREDKIHHLNTIPFREISHVRIMWYDKKSHECLTNVRMPI
jgi:hypothetical protein